MGGGAIRINEAELQKRALHAIGMSDKSINDSFGFLIEALEYEPRLKGA
ncbi:MAG: amino acid--tRNA ligase-related protein [Candidatus Micrarchaeia archaeon]